ncbi:MAG: hypothetical protein AAGG44_07065 [Planctomycetota bacterium]
MQQRKFHWATVGLGALSTLMFLAAPASAQCNRGGGEAGGRGMGGGAAAFAGAGFGAGMQGRGGMAGGFAAGGNPQVFAQAMQQMQMMQRQNQMLQQQLMAMKQQLAQLQQQNQQLMAQVGDPSSPIAAAQNAPNANRQPPRTQFASTRNRRQPPANGGNRPN